MNSKSMLDLNEQFLEALNLLENTNNHLFITGKAGTGKSTLLNHFRRTTQKPNVVLAPTGIAAVNIEGETIHSFFGFPPGINANDARKEANQRRDNQLFSKLEMIVIDEISMVRSDLLDAVDIFLRTIKRDSSPFGGVQMVFIGDLFQLPPVVTQEERDVFTFVYESPYFFDSIVMREILSNELDNFKLLELEKIYRQDDNEFIELLNSVRSNMTTFSSMKKLNERVLRNIKNIDEYVYLVGTNAQAEEINSERIERLTGDGTTFEGLVYGAFDKKALPTEEKLKLKVGARVMFVKNDPEGRWINGTIGTVIEIPKGVAIPTVKVQIDNGNKVDVKPVSWNNYKSSFNKEKGSIEKQDVGSFTQLPLKLAWAFTIHKSQGKTFDKVILDIGRGAFAHGQIYVALSRCRTFEGLILKKPLRSFDIKMDPTVQEFMNSVKAK